MQARIGAGSSADVDDGLSPTLRELTQTLSFSPGDGRIWLNDQRMVLWRSSTYGAMRRELIASLGQDQARSLLTRVGYGAGARDAELVMRMWPGGDPANVFNAGPRMHKLEGIVRPETVRFEFDIGKGDFFADFLWHDSSEDDEHIAAFGMGTESACWMQVGYASGYATAFMGKPIIYREVACRSAGAEVCRVVGQPADQWDHPEQDLRYFTPQASTERVRRALVPVTPVAPAARRPASALSAQGSEDLIGISPGFSAARHLIERVAPTQASVLFTGPSGSGKELFAQTLHQMSPRAGQRFMAINCAAIPENLLESELFGYEKGAYTGAAKQTKGKVELANGGTFFLDEVGDLPMALQAKLLRFLQERVIERVGGQKLIAVDARIVAATNVDLRAEVAAGRFREDLFFRLNVFPIALPALKDRRDDIPLLMESFLRKYSLAHGREVSGFTPRAVQALLQYHFPGNVRELQNLVERGVIMVEPDEAIDVHHLFRGGESLDVDALGLGSGGRLVQTNALLAPAASSAAKGERAAARKSAMVYQTALLDARYNVAEAARQMGLTRAQMAYRARRLGLL